MITNLNFINSDSKLFEAFTLIDNFFISIDAATKKTYENIRKLADWSLLMRNLKKLGQFCSGQNIIARFAIQRKNISEIAKFVDFIYGFKFFKEIIFEPAHLFFVGGEHKLIAWDYRDLISCKKELNLAYKKAKEYGLKCKEHLTSDAIAKNERLFLEKGYSEFLSGCFRSFYESRFPHNNPCNFLERNLFISPKMEVYACPSGYRAGELLLGDLKKENLEKILKSDLVRKLQDGLSRGIRQKVCRFSCFTFEGQIDDKENY
jgi:sulfatase maturation enzyme AslB (radical SAM superfamily)